MSSPWTLFQPLDRVLAASPAAKERSAQTVSRVLAVGHIVGALAGLGNLWVPGALHPDWRTGLYSCAMAALLILGLVLLLVRRPGHRALTAVVFSSLLSYLTIVVCVIDASTFASPLMLLFGAVGSALLLSARAFLMVCLLMPVVVAIGLGITWLSSPTLLAVQVGVQSGMLVSAMYGVYWLRRRAERLLTIVIEAAHGDHLTGLLNRRGLTEQAHVLPAGRPVCLVALDLDHFKMVNDVHGHAIGDQVLTAVAGQLRTQAPDALIARVGGEEFVLLAPSPDLQDAARLAERAHRAVRAVREPVPVTCSVGYLHVRVPTAGDPDEWLWQTFEIADAALYQAKRRGRDQVIAAGTPEASRELEFAQPDD